MVVVLYYLRATGCNYLLSSDTTSTACGVVVVASDSLKSATCTCSHLTPKLHDKSATRSFPLLICSFLCSSQQTQMGSEQEKKTAAVVDTVEVEGFQFPAEIITPSAKPLSLLGHGVTDIEIHFLQIKFNAVGIYLHKDAVVEHLRKTNLQRSNDGDDAFFDAIIAAPAEKLLRVVVIKEIKGSQYGVQLESSVRDRLVAADRYDDDEEEALDKVAEFFQSKYFRPGSVVTFHFPATTAGGTAAAAVEISFATEGKDEAKVAVENHAVAEMIQRWYLGGGSAVSQTAVKSLADHFAAILSSSPAVI